MARDHRPSLIKGAGHVPIEDRPRHPLGIGVDPHGVGPWGGAIFEGGRREVSDEAAQDLVKPIMPDGLELGLGHLVRQQRDDRVVAGARAVLGGVLQHRLKLSGAGRGQGADAREASQQGPGLVSGARRDDGSVEHEHDQLVRTRAHGQLAGRAPLLHPAQRSGGRGSVGGSVQDNSPRRPTISQAEVTCFGSFDKRLRRPGHSSAVMLLSISSWSATRARDRRDITVPSLRLSTAAISA